MRAQARAGDYETAIGVFSISVVQVEFHQVHVGRSISASWTSISCNEAFTYVVHLSGNKGQNVDDQDELSPTLFQLCRDKSRGGDRILSDQRMGQRR